MSKHRKPRNIRNTIKNIVRDPRTYIIIILVPLYVAAHYFHWELVLAVLHLSVTFTAGSFKRKPERKRARGRRGKSTPEDEPKVEWTLQIGG